MPYTADEETVKKDFADCGEITFFKALKDENGAMKGICFVTYKDQESVDKALAYSIKIHRDELIHFIHKSVYL